MEWTCFFVSEDYTPILDKLDSVIGPIIQEIKCKSRQDIIESLNCLNEEVICKTRDILFDLVVKRYEKQCISLNIGENGKPVLKMKERRGDNAQMSSIDDVYEMSAYVLGLVDEVPRGPLSSQSTVGQINSRKENLQGLCECPSKKCREVVSQLQAKISELMFTIKELNITKAKSDEI